MRKSVVIGTGVVFLLIYMIGYFPYMFNSLRLGGVQFLASFALRLRRWLFLLPAALWRFFC